MPCENKYYACKINILYMNYTIYSTLILIDHRHKRILLLLFCELQVLYILQHLSTTPGDPFFGLFSPSKLFI